MTAFQRPLRPEDVGELVDLSVQSDSETLSMALLQLEGTAALYNILCERPFAFLADEVGMGKTYQAMALAAVLWNEKPDARVLFISPRQNLQEKWVADYQRFFASNYRRAQGHGDDLVSSVLFREPLHRPGLMHNLRDWATSLASPGKVAAFLRHTSFTRPVYLRSEDFENIGGAWGRTAALLRGLGLDDAPPRERMTRENASRLLNLTFARSLNARLARQSTDGPYFDLVIVDEAQCLRRPDNQTNQVFHEVLRGQVAKWLFMSATPAHSGPGDIGTIVNHYPGRGVVLESELTADLPALQRRLQDFMVRRQRRYRTTPPPTTVGKETYRLHDAERWAVGDAEMDPLATLAMGLVQKGMVGVLQGRSNRYRIGFLSSFESLQTSIGRTLPGRSESTEADSGHISHGEGADDDEHDEGDQQDRDSDWYQDHGGGTNEPEAPDTSYVQALSQDFTERFGIALPHPKVDSVVDKVAELAFADDVSPGGEKFLIFARRVSTVATLRQHLTERYIAALERRVRSSWRLPDNWRLADIGMDSDVGDDEASQEDDVEAVSDEPDADALRRLMARGAGLDRFRQTFRASGRNALFFEDAWLERLCRAGGTSPQAAATRLPDAIWAESLAHASHGSGVNRKQHRAERVRYLAAQGVLRAPEIFGLGAEHARPWRLAYEAALHRHVAAAKPDDDARPTPELFETRTLWGAWDERFAGKPLELPAAHPETIAPDDLCRRQVARTILGQLFRLTDTLVDLYFAYWKARERGLEFADVFLDWLESDDPGALQLRRDCELWLRHLRLIVDSSLDGAGKSWSTLAREETWPQLHNLRPVLEVTGGSGGHRSATRQFRTPSLPRVIVCTDTLKEGVDLHLFCDRVVHYGVAWTSGDLEQRVGRVDRYFSQIERRLAGASDPDTVRLEVGYPHVVSSLERGQVERVIERQRQVEHLMSSPLAGTIGEDKELLVDGLGPRVGGRGLEPFAPREPPAVGHSVVAVSAEQSANAADHYARWHQALIRALDEEGWRLVPAGAKPAASAQLHVGGRPFTVEWSYDTQLDRYAVTIAGEWWPDGPSSPTAERRRKVDGRYRVERFVRVLVPTPADDGDRGAIESILACLRGDAPLPSP